MKPTLVVLVGPTGIGKTELSLSIAKHFNTEIISADSRQVFKELKIGTAAPTLEQLASIPHHLVGNKSILDYYSAWEFEQDALLLLDQLFAKQQTVLLTGGSMMYIDAICKGIDDIPSISEEVRKNVWNQYETEGLDSIRKQLKLLDPEFYKEVDLKNHKRVIHAVEVCIMSGKAYSSFRTNTTKQRPFNIIKVGLEMDREELYNRINLRVDTMVEAGLFKEAKEFYPQKNLNSLNTVGYKEIFAHWDNEYDEATAIELIKRNSRRYAKKQLSWFRRDQEIKWFHPKEKEEIIKYISSLL